MHGAPGVNSATKRWYRLMAATDDALRVGVKSERGQNSTWMWYERNGDGESPVQLALAFG